MEALKAGYRVRAAIRRESSIEQIKATDSIQPYLPNLEFIIVKDITQEGAFDEALKGATYVIHVASPMPMPVRPN